VAESPKSKTCKIEKCKRPYRAKGYCQVHYKKWRRGEYGVGRYKTCNNEGCRKPMAKNTGLCAEHQEALMKSKQKTASVAAPAPAAT